jgi:hypothetical protein
MYLKKLSYQVKAELPLVQIGIFRPVFGNKLEKSQIKESE